MFRYSDRHPTHYPSKLFGGRWDPKKTQQFEVGKMIKDDRLYKCEESLLFFFKH